MIYFASYFQPENHHGRVVSISRRNPAQFQHIHSIPVFAPSAHLLAQWKHNPDEALYTAQYREEIKANWSGVRFWLDVQSQDEEVITLCCWEKAGEFCHRNLVARLVQKHLPQRFGGCDKSTSGAQGNA